LWGDVDDFRRKTGEDIGVAEDGEKNQPPKIVQNKKLKRRGVSK